MITTRELNLPNVAHGFFTREGGFSAGIFSSMNAGLGSGDDIEAVKRNRAKAALALGVAADHLVSGYQVHGTDVAVVSGPMAERPKVDGLVTSMPGVALGVLTADCGPLLFADAEAGVIGAAHAGWKGALHGIYRSTVEAMEKLGARRERVTAVIGPTISQAAYEVGPEFPGPFLAADKRHAEYFIPSVNERHHMFDLPRFLSDRMKAMGVGQVLDLGFCTYADDRRFFSYRRATHRGERDYGRLLSAIVLK